MRFPNFFSSTLSSGIDNTTTSVGLDAVPSSLSEALGVGPVWGVIYDDAFTDPSDDSNAEFVRVEDVSGNTLTVVRGQEGTSAVSHNAGGSTYRFIGGPSAAAVASADCMNVLSFGAKPDSGTTDNVQAFQAAIDFLAGIGGGTVYVPGANGYYEVSTAVQLKDGVYLVGDGYNSRINRSVGAGETIVFGTNADRIGIRSIRFTGGLGIAPTGSNSRASAINFNPTCTECFVRDCFIENVNIGINAKAVDTCWIENNVFSGFMYRCVYGGTSSSDIVGNVRILNNQMDATFDSASLNAGIYVAQRLKDSIISGNRIASSPAYGVWLDRTVTGSGRIEDCVISNNVILTAHNDGILVDNSVALGDVRSIIVQDNHIRSSDDIGIHMRGTEECTVSGNFVRGSGSLQIRILETGSIQPHRCTVIGNSVHDGQDIGIEIRGAFYCLVASNMLLDNSLDGVSLRNGTNGTDLTIVSNNQVRQSGGDGIDVGTSVSNSLVHGNMVTASVGTNIVDSGTGTVLADNVTA